MSNILVGESVIVTGGTCAGRGGIVTRIIPQNDLEGIHEDYCVIEERYDGKSLELPMRILEKVDYDPRDKFIAEKAEHKPGSKFKVGDTVVATKGPFAGRTGIVKNIEGSAPYFDYDILLEDTRLPRAFYEENLAYPDELPSDYFSESKSVTEPKLKVGDVVKDVKHPTQSLSYPVYIIKESIALFDENANEDKPSGFSYEVAPIDSPDESTTVNESSLRFWYHDTNWEEYFTESVGNGLPAWRGELYSYIHLLDSDINDPKYNDYTLPPMRMKHIIEEHSIRKRIDAILGNEDFKSSIAKKMPCPVNELYDIRDSIMTKINVINGVEDIEKISKNSHGHRKLAFGDKEERLISLVGYYDKYKHVDKNDNTTESKDHYPSNMSDYDILKAIKEAYETAEKVEKRKYAVKGNRASIPEGVILFQGTSKDRLKIQFYYHFDDNHIYTAYPVFVDTTNRPDLRHPDNKNKKRQN